MPDEPVVPPPAPPPPKPRLARVTASPRFLTGDLTEGMPTKRMVKEGLPATAKLVGGSFDTNTLRLTLIFEDKTFAEVSEGDVIPEIPIVFVGI